MVCTAGLPFGYQLRAEVPRCIDPPLLLPAPSLARLEARAQALWWLPVLRRAARQQQSTTAHVARKVSVVPSSVRARRGLGIQRQSGSQVRIGLSSGTLPLVNSTPRLKVSRRALSASVSATRARTAAPPAPPNPTVNRTPHGRPGLGFISFSPKLALPRVAGYLER